MGSAISETSRSGPQAVKDARSARLVEPFPWRPRTGAHGLGVVCISVRGDERDVRCVAVEVAEIVRLRGLCRKRRLPASPPMQKKFGEKGFQASFFSRFRRSPCALARGRSGRGARAPERSEERRGPRPGLRARSASAFSAASA